MKYIITKEQYNLINEALGVPENIHEAALEFYDLFLEDLKSINQKEKEYKFYGDVNIVLGDRKKIEIDEYTLKVIIHEHEEYDELPQIASMGMGQQFMFDRDIMMKRVDPSTSAEFSIDYVVSPEWEPNQLVEEFEKNRDSHISSLAHEIKHKYDKQAKPVDLIGHDAEYSAVQSMPHFEIPVIDNKFRKFLYYTNVAENLVRTTEVASDMKIKNISKDQFREFLENNQTFKTLVDIKNFTYDKLIQGMYDSMDKINEILETFDVDTDGMSDEEKINKILRIFYVRLSNMKLDTFNDYLKGPMGGLFELFSFFGGHSNPKEMQVDKIKDKFFNYITKYQDNPNQFYIDEITKFHKVANQMIKKLSKLYAMASETSTKTESIVNWDLHMKLNNKKISPILEQIEFNRNQLKRRIKTIEDVIKNEIQYVQDEKVMFSDAFEFANNIISWSSDALSNTPEYSKYDYDDINEFIKDEFSDMILNSYVEIDDDDEEDFDDEY